MFKLRALTMCAFLALLVTVASAVPMPGAGSSSPVNENGHDASPLVQAADDRMIGMTFIHSLEDLKI